MGTMGSFALFCGSNTSGGCRVGLSRAFPREGRGVDC